MVVKLQPTVHKTRADLPARAATAAPSLKTQKDAPKQDAFSAGKKLAPFASWYPGSKAVPQLPPGKRLQTFDEAQLQALHRAYWSAPPTADLSEMIQLAFKDPAFKGQKPDEGTLRQVGRLGDDLPKSFPFAWRSRSLAATSHALVEALLTTPKGTSFNQVIDELGKQYPGFPVSSAWNRTQRAGWAEDPARFPFLSKLPKVNGLHSLEPLAEVTQAVMKDGQGRLQLTEALAKQVHTLVQDPRIHYDWRAPEFAKFLDAELNAGGAFTETTLKSLQARFPKLVPSSHAIHAGAAKRLAENVRRLYDNEGIDTVDAMRAAIKARFAVDLGPTMLGYLREAHSDVIPLFRQERDEAAYASARELLEAIKHNPGMTYRDAGATMGLSAERVGQLLDLVRKRWPDELPVEATRRYTREDVATLKAFYDRHELGETAQQMLPRLKVEEPDFFARFPYASSESLYNALREQLHIPPLAETRANDYAVLLADVAKRSPPGTTLREMVYVLQDEHAGAYGEDQAKKLAARADDFPVLKKLRDSDGRYPWEKGKIELTESLAKKVGGTITKGQAITHRQLANRLLKDPAFAKQYPTFSYATIHHLRAKFPALVPYVDDLAAPKGVGRRDAQQAALKKVGDRVEKAAEALGDSDGITVAEIARRTRLPPHRVLAAIRLEPGRFPWHQQRPSGEVDLYLATRLAVAMAEAPLSATLADLEAQLKSDPRFTARYPAFNASTIQQLRERYPDIVPQWQTRQQVVRSKLLADALTTAPKGTTFQKVVKQLEAAHPGVFAGRYGDEKFVRELWASDPELFSFTKGLGKGELQGLGKTLEPSDEPPTALADRLAKLERIPQRLPVLDKMAELGMLKNDEYFRDFEVLAIQHVLGSQVPLFGALRELGVKPDRASIVAIPYSVSAPVADTLQDQGWDVRVPPLDLEAWYAMVKEALEERIAAAKKSGRQVLVLDDGGLTEMMFEKYPALAKDRQLVKIVEQTRRGITVADGVELREGVVNVAQSWGKYVEGPMIGSSLETKLVSRLQAIGIDKLKGKHIGVIGYGTIGGPLADFLKAAGAHVTVLDTSEASLKDAKQHGLDVTTDREKFFGQQDIIVGATGVRSMTAEDLALLKDGAIIGSASSKLVEIDVDALAAMAKAKGGKLEVIDSKSHPPTVRFTGPDGRKVTLLARGFPLNFDGSVEDIAAERIQLTRGLMLIGALQAAGMSAAGIHRLEPELQLNLLRAFEAVGGRKVGREVVEALDLAKNNLGHLAQKRGDLAHDRRHRS